MLWPQVPEERAAWEAARPGSAARPLDFVPRRFAALRQVPAYARAVRERFERCLDLYLCPRLTRKKLDMDPEDLLPKLPDPAGAERSRAVLAPARDPISPPPSPATRRAAALPYARGR